jgi:pilus assembly protein CpaC
MLANRITSLRLFLWLTMLVTTCLSSLATAADEKYVDTVTVVQGQTTLLPVPGVVRVSIGEEEIANAQPTGPGEILLTGLRAGVTDLRVWTEGGAQRRYLLRVVDNSWVRILEVANIVLADVEGVTAREENGIVFIEGRILREQDVAVVEDLRNKLAKEAQAGSVVFNVVKPNVNLTAMVMMDVQVVEVRKQDLNKFGIDWDTSTGGPTWGIWGNFEGSAFDKVGSGGGLLLGEDQAPLLVGLGPDGEKLYAQTSIGSRINFLQQEGIARVLAQPKLVTRSGSKAEFLAGGEVPIPVPQRDGLVTVEFKQVGVILKMLPVADPDGFIQTAINVEVSAIDESVTVRDIPGFSTRKTSMEMNVLSGQTMVISGMLQAEDSKSLDKFPGLSMIPIVGELFKSRDFQQRTTELMIFVTPYLVDPDSKSNRDLLRYAKDLNKNGKREATRFSIFD